MLEIMKLSLDSFLLAGGLKTLFFLKIFLDSPIISLNVDPINILDTNTPSLEVPILTTAPACRHKCQDFPSILSARR